MVLLRQCWSCLVTWAWGQFPCKFCTRLGRGCLSVILLQGCLSVSCKALPWQKRRRGCIGLRACRLATVSCPVCPNVLSTSSHTSWLYSCDETDSQRACLSGGPSCVLYVDRHRSVWCAMWPLVKILYLISYLNFSMSHTWCKFFFNI